MKSVRIACGSGYWGDDIEPGLEIARRGNVQYLSFDYLAELTMSILRRQMLKDPKKGFVPDIVPHWKRFLPICQENGIKMICNAGGSNPSGAADAVEQLCKEMNIHGLKIGMVTGDDLTDRLDEIRNAGVKLTNMDTGEEDIDRVRDKIVGAYAYAGADGIIQALDAGCDHVIAGRVSDISLYVGPIMHELGRDYSAQYNDKIGGAVNVAHVVECGSPCTGGNSNLWASSPENWHIGFPIIDMFENGEAIISKLPGTGGMVNQWTMKEHLTYEVIDPNNYIMPDGIADFTKVHLEEIGENQVKFTNMKGKGRPEMFKVCIGVDEGFMSESMLIYPWPQAYEKAQEAERLVRKRLDYLGVHPEELRFDYVGVNTLHGSTAPAPDPNINEVGLRIVAKTKTYAEADLIRKNTTHLWTYGPMGAACGVNPGPRKVIGLWPTLVPAEFVKPQLTVKEIK